MEKEDFRDVNEQYLKSDALLLKELDEERQSRENLEPEAFNDAWDKPNGVKKSKILKGE